MAKLRLHSTSLIGLLEKNDLSSVENLQNYQAGMKRLYGLEKFAFIDSNGLIYTSRGTRTDIDKYSIDYNNLAGPEISVKNLDKDNKKNYKNLKLFLSSKTLNPKKNFHKSNKPNNNLFKNFYYIKSPYNVNNEYNQQNRTHNKQAESQHWRDRKSTRLNSSH